MFRLDLPVGFLLLFGLLQGRQLAFGQDQALLGHPGFQGLKPLLEGLQVVTEPHRPDPSRGDDDPLLAQFVGRSQLSISRELHRNPQCCLLHRIRDPVLEQRLLAGYLIEGRLATVLVQFLVPVEGVSAVTHNLTGLGHIAQLPGQFQKSQLGLQYFFLLCSHLTLPPLLWGHLITLVCVCQIKS